MITNKGRRGTKDEWKMGGRGKRAQFEHQGAAEKGEQCQEREKIAGEKTISGCRTPDQNAKQDGARKAEAKE